MARAEGRPEGREGDPVAGDSLVRTDRPLTRADPEQKDLCSRGARLKAADVRQKRNLTGEGKTSVTVSYRDTLTV